MPTERQSPAQGRWSRSKYCVGESNCVEVAALGDGWIGMRNSRMPAVTLVFDLTEWEIFLDALKAGQMPVVGR